LYEGDPVLFGFVPIRPFLASDEGTVVVLWERCGLTRPWNDPHEDIRRKRAVRPDLFLIGVLDGRIVASVMTGYEGIEAGSTISPWIRPTGDRHWDALSS
jgi:hypothetical protein